MSLLAYHDSPYFASGVDMQTTDGTAVIWDNTRALDMASLAPRDLFCGHADHRHEFVNDNPLLYARGGFTYRTGLTTLAIYIDSTDMGDSVTPRLRVKVAGVTRIDTPLVSGMQLYSSAAMASWGLANGADAEVELEIFDSGAPSPELGAGRAWGTHYLVDAWVGPASALIADAWPGVPTSRAGGGAGTGPTQAGLLQLGNAADWLARRIAAVPQPLFQRVISSPELPWWTQEPGEGPRHLWSGGGPRGTYDRLRCRVVWVAGSGTSQRIALLINGTEVATTPTWSTGWGVHDFAVDISGYAATTVLRVEARYIPTGPDAGGFPARLTVENMELYHASPAFLTMFNRPEPDFSSTWTVRGGDLNNLSNWLAAIKARIDAAPDRWDRIRIFRSSYAYDRREAVYLQGRYMAVRRLRAGARLIVRGSNIKLGWGPFSATLNDPKEPFGEYGWSWGFEEALVSGDQVETKEIFLDALPGLLPGMQYQVYGGDVRFAYEEPR